MYKGSPHLYEPCFFKVREIVSLKISEDIQETGDASEQIESIHGGQDYTLL